MTRVACIGEAMIELSMDGTNAAVGVAGDTLNTAIYMRRSAPELSVDYVTCLGTDPFSDRILDFVQGQDLGTDNIRRIEDASPGLYAITTTDDGERSFTYWRSSSAARRLFEDHDFSLLAGYDAIYLTGISLAILPADVRSAFAEWLEKNPVTFIFDSNYRPKLWESAQAAKDTVQRMWSRADVALPSIDDEMALYSQSADQVAERFLAMECKGALKRGEGGPLSLGSEVRQAYAPAPRVVDTTAAGDSFNAGYLASVLTGKSQEQALASGHALAREVVQYRGAIILG